MTNEEREKLKKDYDEFSKKNYYKGVFYHLDFH